MPEYYYDPGTGETKEVTPEEYGRIRKLSELGVEGLPEIPPEVAEQPEAVEKQPKVEQSKKEIDKKGGL